MVGDHQHAAELIEERLEVRAPHVLVVHDLLQVVVASEVVQQPGGGREGVVVQPAQRRKLIRFSHNHELSKPTTRQDCK